MSERIVSLNPVEAEFSIEDIEPRMEMQILGIGSIPQIRRCHWVHGPRGTSGNTYWIRYCTTYSYTTITRTPGGGMSYNHVV